MGRMQSVGVALTVVNFLILAALATGAAVTAAPQTVRAGRFEVVDAQGRVRAVLTAGDTTTMLALNDRRTERRVTLVATDDGASLTLEAGPDRYLARLGTVRGLGTVLSLNDPKFRGVLDPQEVDRLGRLRAESKNEPLCVLGDCPRRRDR